MAQDKQGYLLRITQESLNKAQILIYANDFFTNEDG